MGHDITAYPTKDKVKRDSDHEIAYLRRTAFDVMNQTIYIALNCTDRMGLWPGGQAVSGNGTSQYFTRDELKMGLRRLQAIEGAGREREFLTKCLDYPGDGVLISFC